MMPALAVGAEPTMKMEVETEAMATGYGDARGRSNGRPPAFPAKRVDPWGDGASAGGPRERAAAIVGSGGARWCELLQAVVSAGYGLTVSATSDGGAVSLALLVDGQPHKRYANEPDALAGLMEVLLERLSAPAGTTGM